MTEMTVKTYKKTVDVFEFRKGYEYAIMSVDNRLGAYGLTIESSFGGYVYTWFNIGVDFYDFLSNLSPNYLATKLEASDEEVDLELTIKNLKKEILDLRRDKSIDAETAREEWESLGDLEKESDLDRFLEHTKIDGVYEFIATKKGLEARDFERFYNIFWEDFAKALSEHDEHRLKVTQYEPLKGFTIRSYARSYAYKPSQQPKIQPPLTGWHAWRDKWNKFWRKRSE